MKALKSMSVFLVLFVAFLLLTSVYTVHEGQHAILLRLGKIITGSDDQAIVKGPGLHFKVPLINNAKIFDTRLQTLDIERSRIVTAEKKDVLVDYFAKWRINNVPLYYTRTSGNVMQAQTLLEQKLNDGLRAQFGKRNISEVVSGERADIMEILRQQADKSAKSLGIKVVDVRIKSIDLPVEVSAAVYDRMRAERERIATEHRADGKAAAQAIRSKADANVAITLATAQSDAKKLRGKGDATAAKIYADAYKKNPEFFQFYRSMAAYRDVFNNKNDLIVLRPDSEFFKYFNHATQNHKVHAPRRVKTEGNA